MKKLIFLSIFVLGLSLFFMSCNFDFTHPTTPFELSVGYQIDSGSIHTVSSNYIDDFFDGDDMNYIGTTWGTYSGSDAVDQGTHAHSIIPRDNDYALRFDYTIAVGTTWQSANLILPLSNPDISSHYDQDLLFEIKTTCPNPLYITLNSPLTVADSYDHYVQDISGQIAGTNWTTIYVSFNTFSFSQGGWGGGVDFMSVLSNTTEIQLVDKTAGYTGTIFIDNVRWTNY